MVRGSCSPCAGVQLGKRGLDGVGIRCGRGVLCLSETRADDALGLVGELLLVGAGGNDEVGEGEEEADDERAGGLLLEEDVDEVEDAVLEVRGFALGVDI